MKQKNENKTLKLIRENIEIEVAEYFGSIALQNCEIVSTAKRIAEIVYKNDPFDGKHEAFVYRIIGEISTHGFEIGEDKEIYYFKQYKNSEIDIKNINELKEPMYVNFFEDYEANKKTNDTLARIS